MKKLLITAGLAAALTIAAQAKAQDAGYSYYGAQVPRQMSVDPMDQARLYNQARENNFRNLPQRGGRDPRGGFYGRPTVWPGDYKDALDRGSWPAGDRTISIAPHRQWPD